MGERYLELHDEYRNRWIIFHMADGTERDSRQINWRRVEWERVVKLEARLRGHTHVVDCTNANFKFFMNFKLAKMGEDHLGNFRQLIYWVIGWTDGETAFLKQIDFKTGLLVREYTQPLDGLVAHIHPRVQGMVAGQKPGTYTEKELGYEGA